MRRRAVGRGVNPSGGGGATSRRPAVSVETAATRPTGTGRASTPVTGGRSSTLLGTGRASSPSGTIRGNSAIGTGRGNNPSQGASQGAGRGINRGRGTSSGRGAGSGAAAGGSGGASPQSSAPRVVSSVGFGSGDAAAGGPKARGSTPRASISSDTRIPTNSEARPSFGEARPSFGANESTVASSFGTAASLPYEPPRENMPALAPTVSVQSLSPRSSSSVASTSGLLSSDTTLTGGKQDPVKVYVRVRPLTGAEAFQEWKAGGIVKVVSTSGVLQLTRPIVTISTAGDLSPARAGRRNPECGSTEWQFDHCFDGDASQEHVFNVVGESMIRNVADGFHGCVFAYGQTGSGKSHSVFGGVGEDRGLLPRIAEALQESLDSSGNESVDVLDSSRKRGILKLSYLEIYNERVRDLLNPEPIKDEGQSLDVRQHPKFGVFVPDLIENVVQSTADVHKLLDFGHKIRVVGRTNMNVVSSRSHAIVVLHVEQNVTQCARHRPQPMQLRLRARLTAVDLAGAERGASVGSMHDAPQAQVIERGSINRSLWALGLMISRLAQGEGSKRHVPYRNSKLTYLLSDSLMGNCRTAMLACVPPTSEAYSLTESTLRFASCVKEIRTRPTRNEVSMSDLVASLRAEIGNLKRQLAATGTKSRTNSTMSDVSRKTREALQERILTAEKLESQVNSPWERQCSASATYDVTRAEVLKSLGVDANTLQKAWSQGENIKVVNDADPYLVNVCDDPLLSGCLTYKLREGEEVSIGSDEKCKIRIDGLGIRPVMCSLVCRTGGQVVEVRVATESDQPDGGEDSKAVRKVKSEGSRLQGRRTSLYKQPTAKQVFLNGEPISTWAELRDRDRLRIGCTHRFTLFIPRAASHGTRRKTVDNIIDNFVQTSQQALAKEFASQLEERIGRNRAVGVFKELQALQPLIDEANEITSELRGGGGQKLAFRAQVLADVTRDNYRPDVIVALRVPDVSADPLSPGSPAVMLGNSAIPLSGSAPALPRSWQSPGTPDAAKKSEDVPSPDSDAQARSEIHAVGESQGGRLLAMWPLPKFHRQLEALRDLYQEVSERESPWLRGVDPNPWEDELLETRVLSPSTSSISKNFSADAGAGCLSADPAPERRPGATREGLDSGAAEPVQLEDPLGYDGERPITAGGELPRKRRLSSPESSRLSAPLPEVEERSRESSDSSEESSVAEADTSMVLKDSSGVHKMEDEAGQDPQLVCDSADGVAVDPSATSTAQKGRFAETNDGAEIAATARDEELRQLRQELSKTSLSAQSSQSRHAAALASRDAELSTLRKKLDELSGELKRWRRRAYTSRSSSVVGTQVAAHRLPVTAVSLPVAPAIVATASPLVAASSRSASFIATPYGPCVFTRAVSAPPRVLAPTACYVAATAVPAAGARSRSPSPTVRILSGPSVAVPQVPIQHKLEQRTRSADPRVWPAELIASIASFSSPENVVSGSVPVSARPSAPMESTLSFASGAASPLRCHSPKLHSPAEAPSSTPGAMYSQSLRAAAPGGSSTAQHSSGSTGVPSPRLGSQKGRHPSWWIPPRFLSKLEAASARKAAADSSSQAPWVYPHGSSVETPHGATRGALASPDQVATPLPGQRSMSPVFGAGQDRVVLRVPDRAGVGATARSPQATPVLTMPRSPSPVVPAEPDDALPRSVGSSALITRVPEASSSSQAPPAMSMSPRAMSPTQIMEPLQWTASAPVLAPAAAQQPSPMQPSTPSPSTWTPRARLSMSHQLPTQFVWSGLVAPPPVHRPTVACGSTAGACAGAAGLGGASPQRRLVPASSWTASSTSPRIGMRAMPVHMPSGGSLLPQQPQEQQGAVPSSPSTPQMPRNLGLAPGPPAHFVRL